MSQFDISQHLAKTQIGKLGKNAIREVLLETLATLIQCLVIYYRFYHLGQVRHLAEKMIDVIKFSIENSMDAHRIKKLWISCNIRATRFTSLIMEFISAKRMRANQCVHNAVWLSIFATWSQRRIWESHRSKAVGTNVLDGQNKRKHAQNALLPCKNITIDNSTTTYCYQLIYDVAKIHASLKVGKYFPAVLKWLTCIKITILLYWLIHMVHQG